MRTGSRLLSLAGLLLAATTWVAAERREQPPANQTSAPSSPSPPADAGYVGSEACQACHQDAFAKWKASLHIQMTRPVAEATVLGDFSGAATLRAHDRAYTFGRKDGRPTVTMRAGNRPAETHQVDFTLGSKRFQGYLSTLPDGRIYVLPVFWHVESGRWLDWKETTPIPDGAHDMKQIWNVNCFNCHATNLDRGYEPARAAYRTHWTELGIGCEACHGPGRDHITLTDGWAKDPASMPRYSSRASNRQLSDTLKIFSPRSAEPRRTFDSCAYCHGNKRNVFTTFQAGDRYEDHALPFLLSEPLPEFDAQGEFWPDGRPNRFNRPQALMLSGCFKAGAIACTNCHVAHGSSYDFSLKVNVHDGRAGDQLCTQCHQSPPTTPIEGATVPAEPVRPRVTSRPADGPDSRIPWTDAQITAHSFHDADSAGSRCVSCHMSDVNWRLLMRRRDHTFQPPVPETTAAYGAPNACTTCHDEKTPEWASRQMDAWWGDGGRRQKSTRLATTMYQAGIGDPASLPALAIVAVDRTQGAVLRASALEFIGQLVGTRAVDGGAAPSQTSTTRQSPAARSPIRDGVVEPRVLGALLGAASDPEPIVRAAAVRTLGRPRHPRRTRAGGAHGPPRRRRACRAGARRRGAARPGCHHSAGPGRRGADPRAARPGRQPALVPRLGTAAGVAGVAARAAGRRRSGRAGGACRDRARREASPSARDPRRPGGSCRALRRGAGQLAHGPEPRSRRRPNIERMIEEAQRRVTPPRGR